MLPKILRMFDSNENEYKDKLYERTRGKMYLQRYLKNVKQQTEETHSSLMYITIWYSFFV